MNDTSRELRYALGTLCDRYNTMISNKDTLDFRLGSPKPYGHTSNEVDAESAYLTESREVSDDLRTLIVEMMDVSRRIRDIEGF
jgi:hypothetical protein